MMDWEVNGWEWPGFLGADKPAVVNCYDRNRYWVEVQWDHLNDFGWNVY